MPIAGSVSKTISRDALSVAERDLADTLARQTADVAARDALGTAASQEARAAAAAVVARDSIDVAVRQAAKDAAQAAVEQEAKDAAAIAARDAKLGKTAAKDAAAKDSKSWLANNPGKVIAGIAATVWAADALANYEKSTDTIRTITKVEDGESGTIKITFSPALEILVTDLIDIAGSKTTPTIDGNGLAVISDESSSMIIIQPANKVTGFTEGGTITVHTSFLGQLGASVARGAAALGSTVAAASKNFMCAFVPFLCAFSNFKLGIGFAILVFLCCCSSALAAYSSMS